MIFGHERQIQYLEKVLKKGRLAHAYLFYGPEHVGKFTVAKYLAGLLNFPETIILSPEETLVSRKERRKDIPIDDIRELKRRLSFAPAGGAWRAAIINEAQNLSQEAADAFLKVLEEPGPNTVILLIASSPEFLPPTVVSRAQPLRFSLVSDNLMAKFLSGKVQNEKERKELLVLSSGRPGILKKLLEDPDYLKNSRRVLKNVLTILETGDLGAAFYFAQTISGDAEAREQAIEYLMRAFRYKLMRAGEGNLTDILYRIKKINRAAKILETTNVNPRLAMDVIFLSAAAPSSC